MANEPFIVMQEEMLEDAVPVEDTIRFTNPAFIRVLSAVMIVLMLLNVVSVLKGAWLSIIPLIVQSIVLLALRQRWPRTRTIIRVWAAILVFGGGSFMLELSMQVLSHALRYTDVLPPGMLVKFILSMVFIVGGITTYRLAGRHIVGFSEHQLL